MPQVLPACALSAPLARATQLAACMGNRRRPCGESALYSPWTPILAPRRIGLSWLPALSQGTTLATLLFKRRGWTLVWQDWPVRLSACYFCMAES